VDTLVWWTGERLTRITEWFYRFIDHSVRCIVTIPLFAPVGKEISLPSVDCEMKAQCGGVCVFMLLRGSRCPLAQ